MPVPAADVAAAIRERLPGVPIKKLHKLLYYAQGHHLGATGSLLFRETISAWDMGPVVGQLWHRERDGEVRPTPAIPLDQSQLNTVGYVVSRYGGLTGADLERLSHTEPPWRDADVGRPSGGRATIRVERMLEWFTSVVEVDEDDPVLRLDPADVAAWLDGAEARATGPSKPDDINAVRARLVDNG